MQTNGFACKLCHMNAHIIHNCSFISFEVQYQMIDDLWSYVQNTQRSYVTSNSLNQPQLQKF
jgi:hypothetical protein